MKHLYAALVFLLLLHGPARATVLPSGFTETLVTGGLSSPTAMAFAPDGRLFVCQQNGRLRVIKNGALLATPFVTLTVDPQGERGLLGVAFDPDFAANGHVYLYYTAKTPTLHNRVSRFTANGDVAAAGSEVPILDLNNLSGATNHNGGALHFGADGKLYVAVGDNANGANSQTLDNLLGKLLRINPDGTIPSDNPFYGQATGINRAVWALGLRNPFTFAFQPGSNRMFINDVGQNAWEEINDGYAGANYGWPDTEGYTTDPRFKSPVHAYGHGAGPFRGCAITGGAFYNPPLTAFPAGYLGDYFFADICGHWINRLDAETGAVTTFASEIDDPVDLAVGADGCLYYLSRGAGGVFKIAYPAGQAAPVITRHPAGRTVAREQTATFTVAASGTPPLSYQWQKNGVNIPGANGTSYTTPPAVLADSGARFRCVVSNAYGSATSNAATLSVTTNRAPTAAITAPPQGVLYRAGETISYAGTGTDPENGNLPVGAFTWQVDFHHGDHVHPFVPPKSGSKTGAFTVPRLGETATNVWYRIYLTVKDSAGLTHTTFRDVRPRVAVITVRASRPGLRVRVDGQVRVTPYSFAGVVGMKRTLGAVTPQFGGGATYRFHSWSDGGAPTHDITTPASDTTYTATFRRLRSP